MRPVTKFRNLVLVGQIIGLMPVQNVLQHESQVAFSWKSLNILYTLFSILTSLLCACIFIIQLFRNELKFIRSVALAVYVGNILTVLTFLQLARNWKVLTSEWISTIKSLHKVHNSRLNVKGRINVFLCTIFIFSAVECCLYIAFISTFKLCSRGTTGVEAYLKKHLENSFSLFGYSFLFGLFMEFVRFHSMLMWNYHDFFIMALSTALAAEFKMITNRLSSDVKQHKLGIKSKDSEDICSNKYWREIREDYNKLVHLCKTVDKSISYIILTSYSTDLIYIVLQLLNSFREIATTVGKVYFFVSVFLAGVRITGVSLFSSSINDESKKLLPILLSVPSKMYNTEVQILLQELRFDRVALTGRHFFEIRRNLILNVAVAVASYELVLLQFNAENLGKLDVRNVTTC